jgi:hypothetical protein
MTAVSFLLLIDVLSSSIPQVHWVLLQREKMSEKQIYVLTRLLPRLAEQLGEWLSKNITKIFTFALHSGSGQTGSILRPRLRLS